MRAPLSWLRELVDIPADQDVDEVAGRLVRAGLEIEDIETVGEVTGPLVVGQVVEFHDEPQSNGKTIRWCQVNVGEAHGGVRGIVCGASNFAVNDFVVAALPGTILPGGFEIAARKTYGHVSDGMLCSSRELGLGEESDGIITLDAPAEIGSDALSALGGGETVFDLAVTPDRGYCFSLRGIARELAISYETALKDPAAKSLPEAPQADRAVIDDTTAADHLLVLEVEGLDASAPSPEWMRQRLTHLGMRPISLIVDITNYVMLLTGQPLHAFDRDKVKETLMVRRARSGESLVTLDGVTRSLDVGDVVVADAAAPLALAGTMGGASSEVDQATTAVLLEAAHFDAVAIARQSRRHKLSTEASRRFERGVDSALQEAAAALALDLLLQHGGGRLVSISQIDAREEKPAIDLPVDRASQVAGVEIAADVVVKALTAVGCSVAGASDGVLKVVPPSWRPDLSDPADLVEEVVRLFGYDAVPSRLPRLPSGRVLTSSQRLRRVAGSTLADVGLTEVLAYPFIGPADLDALGLAADDPRRQSVALANPLSEEQPWMRTTMLPGLLGITSRNLGRGAESVGVFEIGAVSHWGAGKAQALASGPVRPSVASRPTPVEIAGLDEMLPSQAVHLAAVLTGQWENQGWWGDGRAATWADAVEVVRVLARALRSDVHISTGSTRPWHPGRCAEFALSDGTVIGHAGELHPRVCDALALPARTCAVEINLGVVIDAHVEVPAAPEVSTFPVAKEDIAVVVDDAVSVDEVEQAVRRGAGNLLESVRLFDVYTGPQIGTGRKSLAFALRFRASDRTLTAEEVAAARDAAVAQAQRDCGAQQRT